MKDTGVGQILPLLSHQLPSHETFSNIFVCCLKGASNTLSTLRSMPFDYICYISFMLTFSNRPGNIFHALMPMIYD